VSLPEASLVKGARLAGAIQALAQHPVVRDEAAGGTLGRAPLPRHRRLTRLAVTHREKICLGGNCLESE
jgi:hypothetical protein